MVKKRKLKKKKNTGRPKVKIDWNFVDEYLRCQCDGVGIASLLGINEKTFYRRCLSLKRTI